MTSTKKAARPGPRSLPRAKAAKVRRALVTLSVIHGTDAAVGGVVGISGLSVRRIRERANEPSMATAEKVARALGWSVADLLAGTGKAVAS